MTTETQTTEQVLAKILTLCKNNGTTLDELLKLPVLDAEGKIPAALLCIVGALSAGAVIESGDNVNGEYIRFADGTQICYYTKSLVGTAVNKGNNAFGAWTYPAAFAGLPPSVSATYNAEHTTTVRCAIEHADLTGIQNMYIYSQYGSNFTVQVGNVLCIAVCKWK